MFSENTPFISHGKMCHVQLSTFRKEGTTLLSRYSTGSSQGVKGKALGTVDFHSQ